MSLIVSLFLRCGRVIIDVLGALLFGNRDAFGGRAEPPQQGVDGQCDNPEHRDLAQGIEAAEVDQNDVHDVSAAAFCVGVLDEIPRNAVGRRPGHCRECKRRQPRSGPDCDHEVAEAIPSYRARRVPRIDPLDAFGQPSQTQQQKHRGYGLDDKLRQGKIGR